MRAEYFFSPAKKKTRPETVSCKFHRSVFYKYFRSRESIVGLSHSSGDRVVVSVGLSHSSGDRVVASECGSVIQ